MGISQMAMTVQWIIITMIFVDQKEWDVNIFFKLLSDQYLTNYKNKGVIKINIEK